MRRIANEAMRLPGLSREIIEQHADAGSVERGREYFEDDAVKSLRRTAEGEIEAYVQGSDIAPYHVVIRHDGDGIVSAECTCPYVGGTWCRHIVASLLSVLEGSDDAPRSLSAMLDEFDRVELIRLVEKLADSYPEIADYVESEAKGRV